MNTAPQVAAINIPAPFCAESSPAEALAAILERIAHAAQGTDALLVIAADETLDATAANALNFIARNLERDLGAIADGLRALRAH